MCFDHGLKQFALQVPTVGGCAGKYQNQASQQKNQKDALSHSYSSILSFGIIAIVIHSHFQDLSSVLNQHLHQADNMQLQALGPFLR